MNNGWICPKCGRTWAYYVSFCPYCNQVRTTFAVTKTNIFENEETLWRDWLNFDINIWES